MHNFMEANGSGIHAVPTTRIRMAKKRLKSHSSFDMIAVDLMTFKVKPDLIVKCGKTGNKIAMVERRDFV